MTTSRPVAAVAAGLAASLVLAGCTGGDNASAARSDESTTTTGADGSTSAPSESPESPESSSEPTPDEETTADPAQDVKCSDDVTETRIPPELSNLSYPDGTVVYEVEVLGENGVRVTGVTDLRYNLAKHQMERRYSRLPFEIVSLDQAPNSFGANWTGPSITGRWVVNDISGACPGDTEVRILWTGDG